MVLSFYCRVFHYCWEVITALGVFAYSPAMMIDGLLRVRSVAKLYLRMGQGGSKISDCGSLNYCY